MSQEISSELLVLQAIASAMESQSKLLSAQTDEIKLLATKVDDVQVRVIRLEEAKHGRDIDRLHEGLKEVKDRLYTVELANATMSGQVTGASFTLNWVYKIAPWIAPLVIALYIFWEARGN
jgi:hypothetical protein